MTFRSLIMRDGGGSGGGTGGSGTSYNEVQLQEAIANGNKRTMRTVLDQLGFEGMELKDVLEAKKQQKLDEEANKNEQLKKDKKWDELNQRIQNEADQKVKEANERTKKYRDELVYGKARNDIITEAMKQGAVDPDDVYQFLKSSITINDGNDVYAIEIDGKLTTIEGAVKELLAKKQHLVKANLRGTNTKEGGGKSDEKVTPGGSKGSTIVTGFESLVNGEINQANMLIEIQALNDSYKGRALDQEFNKKNNLILQKYKFGKAT
jgi:hypothetical protein